MPISILPKASWRRHAVAFFCLIASSLVTPVAARAQSADLVVFAASSLKNALDDAANLYARQTGAPLPKISYAASNTLARQLEQGAPADIFLSADLEWMDYLAERKLIRQATRINLLGNRLVLIAPQNSAATIELRPGVDLRAILAGGRLAICNDAVPAGKYGKAALESLGLWDNLKNQVAAAENVRAALLFVARGEAPLGIVYQTDAVAEPAVKVLDTFPPDSHPPIIYPAAVLRESRHPKAEAFLTFLRLAAARPAFERQGFTLLAGPAAGL